MWRPEMTPWSLNMPGGRPGLFWPFLASPLRPWTLAKKITMVRYAVFRGVRDFPSLNWRFGWLVTY